MEIVMQMYHDLGGDDQVAKGPDFVKGLINEFK
jgi:hypothetical protein